MEVSINCQTLQGKTLDELNNQIQRRTEILHETTEQSIIATTITILKSLRALTKKSKGKILPLTDTITNEDLGISIKQRNDLVVAYHRKDGVVKPCIRIGNKKGARFNITPWWRINKEDIPNNCHVYEVNLSKGRQEIWKNHARCKQHSPWFMVAVDMKSAKFFVNQRYNKIVKRYASLKRDGWTKAMMLTTNRASLQTQSGRPVVEQNIHVLKNLNGNFANSSGTYSITVENSLRNIKKIVGGEGAVTSAMQSAINSTNGYINNWISKHDPTEWFAQKQDTPFPKELQAS